MTRSRTALGLLLTVTPWVAGACLPSGALAQEGHGPTAASSTSAGPTSASVFDEPALRSVRAQLLALRGALEAQGLPAEMIAEKAAEGLSKHVPARPILLACEQLAARLVSARAVIAQLSLPVDNAMLRALVDAQAAGATPAALVELAQKVRSPLPRERVRTTLAVVLAVAELGEREFPIDDALAAVGDAVRTGGAPAVRELLLVARTLRGTSVSRGSALRAQGEHGRPDSPGRSGSSMGSGPPHDVGYGQGRGRGMSNAMR